MKTRMERKAFVSSSTGLNVHRDPNRMVTTEKIDETMLNQLKSISMPYVLPTISGAEPTFKS